MKKQTDETEDRQTGLGGRPGPDRQGGSGGQSGSDRQTGQGRQGGRKVPYILLAVMIFLLITTAAALFIYERRVAEVDRLMGPGGDNAAYDRHYAMIVDDPSDEFWQSVFKGASEAAEASGAYLELMGDDLSGSYSVAELLKMAIAARVDAILLEADGSDELTELIDEAAMSGIPVVTLLKDCTGSKRVSYVGISYYNLGQQYAEQISSIIASSKNDRDSRDYTVMVLMDEEINDSSRTIVYSTIQDLLSSQNRKDSRNVTLMSCMIDSSAAFAAEESIRSLFLSGGELPDIMVCLDETSSACVYQALVDYNRVGRVELVAYYTGDTVLSGIEKNIIYSTTGVDTERMGRSGVEALNEYLTTGFASDYYSVDTFIVDQNTIAAYMGGQDN